jgi:hypothetical protein
MPYLVTVETTAHVNELFILGIADDSMQVHALLYNFYKTCGGFEESVMNFDICIHQINDVNVQYIESLYEKYEEQIQERYAVDGLEDVYDNYKCIPYISDEEKVIFSNAEVKAIEDIIKQATKIL